MTASRDTMLGTYTVLNRYLTRKQITLVLEDLREVHGNRSFKETIEGLLNLHRRRLAEKEGGDAA